MDETIFIKLSDRVDKIVSYLCIALGILMTVTTLTGIMFRYVMTNPLPWTEELARYSMIWMGLLAISMGVKRQEHLGVNLIVKLLPVTFQKILRIMTRVLIAFFLIELIRYGYGMAVNGNTQIAPALQIPMSYVLSSVPVAALVSLIQLFLISLDEIQKMISGNPEKEYRERRGSI